jgi:hypothetical protein
MMAPEARDEGVVALIRRVRPSLYEATPVNRMTRLQKLVCRLDSVAVKILLIRHEMTDAL